MYTCGHENQVNPTLDSFKEVFQSSMQKYTTFDNLESFLETLLILRTRYIRIMAQELIEVIKSTEQQTAEFMQDLNSAINLLAYTENELLLLMRNSERK